MVHRRKSKSATTTTTKDDEENPYLTISHDAHHFSLSKIQERLEVDATVGLSEEEAKKRRDMFGANSLKDEGGIRAHIILFHHLFNFMNLVLLGGTGK